MNFQDLTAFNIIAGLLAGSAVAWACVWIGRFDRLVQGTVAAGILIRLAAGLALFFSSYHDVAWLRDARVGGGFWEPDALTYYTRAAAASRDGLHAISSGEPSPAYVKTLALSMDLIGVTPLTGIFLNLVCYVTLCVLIVAAAGSSVDRLRVTATRLMVACFTFSPALILSSGQSLKDQFFISWLVISSVAVIPVMRWAIGHPIARSALLPGMALLTLATAVIAGVRPYVALFMLATLGAVALLHVLRPQPIPAVRRLARSATIIGLVWVAFAQGAGPYYLVYESRLLGMVGIQGRGPSAVEMLDAAREGFVRTGGRTNIGRRRADHANLSVGQSIVVVLESVAVGAALMVMPAAVADAIGLVDVDTSGMVRVIDLDTLFITLSCGAALRFAWRHRLRLADARPYVMYTAVIAGITAVLMAYVVTNLGTLFRLRTIPAAWIWLLPLALSPVLNRAGWKPASTAAEIPGKPESGAATS